MGSIWRKLCTPRPKVQILRIGNTITLPGGDMSCVTDDEFKYLNLIRDIEVIDFSFNLANVSYPAIVNFFAAQAGQVYTPPTKPKRKYVWKMKKKKKPIKDKADTNRNQNDTPNDTVIQNDNHNHNSSELTNKDIEEKSKQKYVHINII